MISRRLNFAPGAAARGLTLVECMIATVLLGLGASAAMVAVSASYQHQRYATEQAASVDLAQQLLEEVGARPYHVNIANELEPPPGSAQAMHGYTDTLTASGMLITDPAVKGFVRSVVVRPAASQGLSLPSNVGMALVEVTAPSGRSITLYRLLRSD